MSAQLGTALTAGATKVMMLGSGELGKEVTIEFQRLGVEVIAVDRYENAPAMQVAHRHYTVNMLDAAAIRKVIEAEKPDYIVPEIEAIATSELLKLEEEGWNVIPNARATYLTMNREGIRKLAAEELGLPTSKYRFASTLEEYKENKTRINSSIAALMNKKSAIIPPVDKKEFAKKLSELVKLLENEGIPAETKNSALRSVVSHIIFDKTTKRVNVFFHT